MNYRGARMIVGGLTSKNKIDILLYISKEFAYIDNQRDLFDRVVALSVEIFEVDNVTVRLWQNGQLVPVRFLKETTPPRRPLRPGEGYSGAVFIEKKPVNLDNLEHYPDYLDENESTRCAMVVPILFRDEALGTISIEKDTAYFYKKDDLEILEAMASQLALALNEVKLIEGLVEARSRIQSDLKMGRSVQSQIIPSEIAPWNSIRFGHYFEPMVEVSGDYFDVMRSGNSLTCIIADVSGHGVPAALVTMALHFQFRRCVEQGFGLTEMMEELNESIRHRLPDGTYFTTQLIRIYADHTYSYVNAGHVRLMHYKRAQKEFIFHDTKGIPLGIAPVRRTDYEEKFSRLEPGDALVMLTDGFYEQRTATHEETGLQTVINWFGEILGAANPPDAAETTVQFLDRFNKHVEGWPREDDLTLLVLDCSVHLENARKVYLEARKFLREKNLSKAEELALEAYRLDSSLHDNLLLLSRVYNEQSRPDEAARFLSEYVVSSGAHKPEYYHMLGTLYYRNGDIRAAKRELKKSLSLDHTFTRASLMLARCYLKEGARPKAIKTLQQALKSSPANEQVRQSLKNVESMA
ncbi:MAG TPA: SpoIIE family protein phosphatase [Leptospiraceae bacterium]|nr:SpoIIE family protein phosphatase [Leptospiraceae bacterium]HNL67898.1 SpoIIE family protein phosphatase [Leptospiraceae bacterium]HNN60432.1 SpoIIE family protein phosphatase [Leptospiraceae bacterium]HNN73618.1 SpoIIE family protein phosphatase [Leptospiraceae bacterium]